MITVQQIKDMVTAQMEDSTIPDAVLKWVQSNQGKSLRKDNLPVIEGWDTYTIKEYGHTKLICRTQLLGDRKDGRYDFHIADTETFVMVPETEAFKNRHEWCYQYLQERNEKRTNVLVVPVELQCFVDDVNLVIADLEQYKKTKQGFQRNWLGEKSCFSILSREVDKLYTP